MKILMAASEAVPFAKTGGLADMVSALSLALAKQGHEVRIVIPRYYSINIDKLKLEALEGPMGVPMGGGEEWCKVYTGFLPGKGSEPTPKPKAEVPLRVNASGKKAEETKTGKTKAGSTKSSEKKPGSIKDSIIKTSEKKASEKKPAGENPVKIYFIDHENFFGRDGVYGVPSEPDFLDNPRRYTFFCRSVFQLCKKINWYPDLLHAHDWPSALVPVFLKYGERYGAFSKTVSVLTIHNLGYQGVYGKDNFYATGLGWDTFYNAGFEDWNMMNLLKAGICSADMINTVSPNYMEETKTTAYGFRMDGILRSRGTDYRGILNGIDTEIWNPEKDPLVPMPYSAKNMEGKAKAKEVLQKEFGLPPSPETPVIGLISRLTGQKGVGELFGPAYGSAFPICRDMNLQFIILGSGEAWCENEIRCLAGKLSNLKAEIGYDEKTSHLIEAGSDFFLMPSRYEPCGLNQMYSLVYGTIPIVRNTGGLVDTVENFDQETGKGTGFIFDDLTPQAIYNTVGWAIWAYYNRRLHVEKMRIRGMKKDFSWDKSAREYLKMYEEARGKLGY
ncbi:MAG: glycogen synthase [Treponema sp.]|nr:glycogen synthase [Treponema sp.]